MTPETISKLNDFRHRILQCDDLKRQGLPVPDGLAPTDDEIANAILAIRADRLAAAVAVDDKAKANAKPATKIPVNLNDLFKKKEG